MRYPSPGVSPLLTQTPANYMLAGYVTIAIAAVFLVIGVGQWLVLSKWTKRYKAYKELAGTNRQAARL